MNQERHNGGGQMKSKTKMQLQGFATFLMYIFKENLKVTRQEANADAQAWAGRDIFLSLKPVHLSPIT